MRIILSMITMSEFHSFIIFLLISLTDSYRLQCPDISQRPLRASGYCTSILRWEYICLYDTNRLKFSEQCEKNQDYVRPGERYVITGSLRNVDCSSKRYQPFSLWSNISGECLYQKSPCKEEGQVIFSNGSLIEDRKCRCDYTKGYTFIHHPKQKCYCIPSEEDCSCFISKCARKSILSADYECVEEEHHIDSTCPVLKKNRGSLQPPTIKNIHRYTEKPRRKRMNISWILTAAGILLILGYAVTVAISFWKKKGQREKAFKEQIENIENLIQAGANINAVDNKMRSLLFYACSSSYCTHVKENRSPRENRASMNPTIDVEVCSKRCTTVINYLVNTKQADVNIADIRGVTPLMLACQAKCAHNVELLLKHGADINTTDEINKSTALLWAMKGQPNVHMMKVIKILIKNGADVNIGNTSRTLSCQKVNVSNVIDGVPSFFNANKHDAANIFNSFLSNRCGDYVENNQDETPLTKAIKVDHVEIMEILVKAGADVKKDCFAALCIACRYGAVKSFKKLFELVYVCIEDSRGRSLLFHACKALHNLKNRGKDNTSACFSRCTAIISLLIENKVDVNKADKCGVTPLMIACRNKCPTAVLLLLQSKAAITKKDKNGSTALIWAMVRQSDSFMKKIIQILLDYNIDAKEGNDMGFTPLLMACELGDRDIIRLLITYVKDYDNLRDAFSSCIQVLLNPTDDSVLNERLSKLSEKDMITVINNLVKYKRKVIQHKTRSEPFNSRRSSAGSTKESEDEEDWYNSNTYVYNEMTPLLEAFKNKDKPEILELLIEGYLYINKSNDSRITILMKACEFGETYIDIIDMLVQKTFDINTRDENGQTALFVACNQRNPSYKIVQSLLTENRFNSIIDIAIGNNYGRTPLMTLCSHKSNDNIDSIIEIIDLLIEHDPKLIDQKDKSEKTALMYACKYGHIKIVEHLLHKNADINTSDKQGCTVLFVICNIQNPRYKLVEYLFKEYRSHIIQNITISNNSGVTPLMTLCSHRSYDYVDNVIKIINLLFKHLRAASFINQKDNSGKTCLMHACEHGHCKIVEHLLHENADINAFDNNGHTALFLICKKRKLRYDVVESLFKEKRHDNIPDITIGNYYGRTPLMTLCARESNDDVDIVIKIIEHLIKQSPDPEFINQKDNSGKTSLMYACEHGHYKVVEKLVQNKNVKINTRDKNDCTALFLTCSKNNPSYKIVKALFKEKDHSPDVTIGNTSGITPLMSLCSRGNEEQVSKTIDILIKSSTVHDLINQKDQKGKTALIHACEHKHIQIMKQLIDNGASITSECKEIAEIINDEDIITLIQGKHI